MNEHETSADTLDAPLTEARTEASATAVEGPRRRTGRVLAAIAVVVVLVAGVLAFQLTRPEPSEALALRFAKGAANAYHMHMTIDGEVKAAGFGSQPVNMTMDEDISWRVVSVDHAGVATVEVTAGRVSGSVNGQPVPSGAGSMATQMRIAPDGRILSAGDTVFSGTGSGGATFPGMGQFTSLLPDYPVQPGDTWQKDFSQEFPFGNGEIRYATRSSFVRYDDVDGVQAAVVTSHVNVPLDMTVDLGKLFASIGGGDATASELKDVTITYGGSGDFTITTWLSVEDGDLLKASSAGSFDMTMAFKGVPQAAGGFDGAFSGTFTQELEKV